MTDEQKNQYGQDFLEGLNRQVEKEHKEEKKKFDFKRFFKKYLIKLSMKSLDMAILLSVGYALGLQLVRY